MDDDRIRRLFHAAESALPGRPLDWGETITKARRARLFRLVAATAAAAVVLAGGIVGATMLGKQAAEPIPPVQTPPSTRTPTPTETTPDFGVDTSQAIRAVQAFVEAAADGDGRRMWRLMSGPARAPFDGQLARFEEFDMGGISEGIGSWASADPHYAFTEIVSSGDAVAGVVTITGRREVEGRQERGEFAMPVRVMGGPEGRALVEPFLSPGSWDYVSPPLGDAELSRVSGNLTFAARIEARPVVDVKVAVQRGDTGEVVAQSTRRPEVRRDGRRWWRISWMPNERLAPGEYVVTYAGLFREGLSATTLRFIVE